VPVLYSLPILRISQGQPGIPWVTRTRLEFHIYIVAVELMQPHFAVEVKAGLCIIESISSRKALSTVGLPPLRPLPYPPIGCLGSIRYKWPTFCGVRDRAAERQGDEIQIAASNAAPFHVAEAGSPFDMTHSRFLTDISPSRIVCRIISQLVRFSTTTSEGLTAGESLWQKHERGSCPF
jgi:hypothetical protein